MTSSGLMQAPLQRLGHGPAGAADEEVDRLGRAATPRRQYRALATVDCGANVSRPCAAARHRRVARQGQDHRRLPRRRLRRRVEHRPHPRPAERAGDPEGASEAVGALGVDVDDGFEPYYVVDPDKKRVVADLKKKLTDADELLLATDEDREGEAIAWHLLQVLKPKVPVSRMVFHEITKDAIERALDETREIDERLVDAQETRRILDRLYGYEVSPVLWKKVMPRLSAGRVQSVATRLVVERERERMAFVAASYWDLVGTFDPGGFDARLVALDGSRIAQGRDFGADGQREGGRPSGARRGAAATTLADALSGRPFAVRSVDEKPYTRRPAAPFMTSTLQQEASRKLRFSRRRRCASPSGSTRTATSPTCAPTRRRCPRRR